jgi:hypothetical protein
VIGYYHTTTRLKESSGRRISRWSRRTVTTGLRLSTEAEVSRESLAHKASIHRHAFGLVVRCKGRVGNMLGLRCLAFIA